MNQSSGNYFYKLYSSDIIWVHIDYMSDEQLTHLQFREMLLQHSISIIVYHNRLYPSPEGVCTFVLSPGWRIKRALLVSPPTVREKNGFSRKNCDRLSRTCCAPELSITIDFTTECKCTLGRLLHQSITHFHAFVAKNCDRLSRTCCAPEAVYHNRLYH